MVLILFLFRWARKFVFRCKGLQTFWNVSKAPILVWNFRNSRKGIGVVPDKLVILGPNFIYRQFFKGISIVYTGWLFKSLGILIWLFFKTVFLFLYKPTDCSENRVFRQGTSMDRLLYLFRNERELPSYNLYLYS